MRLACHANYVHSHCSTHMPLTLNHPCHFDTLQVISTPSLSFRPEGEICRSATCNINSQNYYVGCRFHTTRSFCFGKSASSRGRESPLKKLLLHPRHRVPNQNLPIIQDLTKRATGPRFRHGLLQARQGLLHPFTGFRLA